LEQPKTHWKKLSNPDYIGAYALEPDKDMILTIRNIKNEVVKGPDGKKEECTVAHFKENVKPMIINATNAKTIEKIYGTPFVEDWLGRKIQIFSDRVKAFGDYVDALRIRPFIPEQTEISTKCADCGKDIQSFDTGKGVMSPEQMAQYTYRKYGKSICAECAQKAKEAEEARKVQDPLA
jgi:ribosomal protein L34E